MCQTQILPHYSAQVPLTYQPSDLHSCRGTRGGEGSGGGGHVNTRAGGREKEEDMGGQTLTPLLHKVKLLLLLTAADCQSKVRSIEDRLIYSPGDGDACRESFECIKVCLRTRNTNPGTCV